MLRGKVKRVDNSDQLLVDFDKVFVKRDDSTVVVVLTSLRTNSRGEDYAVFTRLRLVNGKIPRTIYDGPTYGVCRSGGLGELRVEEFDAAYMPLDESTVPAVYANTDDTQ